MPRRSVGGPAAPGIDKSAVVAQEEGDAGVESSIDSSAILADESLLVDSTLSLPVWDAHVVSATADAGLNLPLDLDGMTWPQLHETYFLQDDPFVGIFDTGWEATDQDDTAYRSPFTALARQDPMAALTKEADDLVHCATTAASQDTVTDVWKKRLSTTDARLRTLLYPGPVHVTANEQIQSTLDATIALYLRHFNCLWPMFRNGTLSDGNLHPILYLVMISIGSMYGPNLQKHFGTLLHKRLRRLLTASLFDLEGPDSDLIWLAHARLLTQVQGLYFGQKKAFSYAQHLGAILIAHARRLNLFEGSVMGSDDLLGGRFQTATTHGRWKEAELQRRLAFGILRADVYTSVLLNTRPLMSFEEVNLTLPMSDGLWHNADNLTPRDQAIAARVETQHTSQAPFSDLLRILLDRDEPKVPVGAVGTELCLFGLQMPVWRFAHDAQQFERLTGGRWARRESGHQGVGYSNDLRGHSLHDSSSSHSQIRESMSRHDRRQIVPGPGFLERAKRRMTDLSSDRERIEAALEAWHAGFHATLRSPDFAQHRTSLGSSILLWNLSHLQLHAPLQRLHDVSYRLADAERADIVSIHSARAWAVTDDAVVATERALSICDIIENELQQPPEQHSHFSFIAFAALHHAAVVLWVTSEVGGESCSGAILPDSTYGHKLQVRDTRGLLEACARLFRDLSPLGGASFGNAAERLSTSPFPPIPRPP
ncbi:hypothetical protein LTR95_003049 [Oleoguttula sp. CCFEE 5521]